MTHYEDALNAIAAATNQTDLNAVYASHITRLIRNSATREELEQVAQAWRDPSPHLFNEAMGWDQP